MDIRRAIRKDIDQILNLLSQVLEVHASIREDLFNHGMTKYSKEQLTEMVKDDNNPIYVIVNDDEVLGYAFCQIRINKAPHLIKTNKTLYIDDFCVDEKYRKQGIGETLFIYIKEEGMRLGCDDITLNCYEGNVEGYNFYKKMGLTVRSSIMEIKLK